MMATMMRLVPKALQSSTEGAAQPHASRSACAQPLVAAQTQDVQPTNASCCVEHLHACGTHGLLCERRVLACMQAISCNHAQVQQA